MKIEHEKAIAAVKAQVQHTARRGTVLHGEARRGAARHDMAKYGTTWHGTARHGTR